PPAIEAGQTCGKHTDGESKLPGTCATRERCFDNRIFGIEACKTGETNNADAGNSQRPHHHCPESQRDLFAKPTIIAHILLMVHGVNDRACTKEQQSFEESVRKKMEHRRAIGAYTSSKEHVTKLRAGRICDNAFDVRLHQTDCRCKNGGGCANYGHNSQ